MTNCNTSAWNPRFVAYATAFGNTPEHQAAQPNNGMNFMLWMSARIREARAAIPAAFYPTGSLLNHNTFDAWLNERAVALRDREAA